MKATAFLAAAALCTAAPAALAQWQPHFYAGLSGGRSLTSDQLVANRESTVTNAQSVSSDFDSTDTGWKVFGGWQVNDWIALEASYVDLGSTRLATHTLSISHEVGTVTTTRRIDGYGIDAVLSAPIGRGFSVFGRVGAYRAHLRAEASLDGGIQFNNGDPNDRTRTNTSNETVGHYGLGAKWQLRPDLSLRLEWERMQDVGKKFEIGASGTTGEANTDLVSLGVAYHF